MIKELNSIFQHFGEDNQLDKMVEECKELIEAIEKYKDGKDSLTHVLEEIADVKVLATQFELHYPEVSIIGKRKITRTINRYNIKIKDIKNPLLSFNK